MNAHACRIALAAALATLAPAAAAQTTLPHAPGARVVTITPEGHRGSEPSVTVNPYSPNQVVGVYGGPGLAYSTDSGRTFTMAEGVQPAGWRSAGDVSVAFGLNNHVYLSYLTIAKLGSASYWGHDAGANGIWVRRSPDGGKTWDSIPSPIKVWPTGHEPGIMAEDMPRIWTDAGRKSPYRGHLYEAWIEWQLDKSIMLFSRSTDDGKTWSKPKRISTHAGYPRDDNGAVVGIIGTVAPDGTMYVVWSDGLDIAFTTSRDGGATFTPSRSILHVGPPYFGGATGIPGLSRAMGFPQVGVDPHNGTLYVCWSDFRNGDVDVFVSHSTDHGRTWSSPLRVNDDPLHDGNDQFLQWLAVDPVSGDVYVQFYDRRADPENRGTRVTLARSTDRGKTFKNYDWSDDTFTGESAFLGDYMWMTAYDGRVYGIWAEAVPAPNDTANAGRRRPSPTVIKVGTADFGRK